MIDDAAPMAVRAAVERIAQARWFVLSTTLPDGRPHAVPILAVWNGGAVHFAAEPDSRKARNLQANPACVVTTSAGGSDLVIEGDAIMVRDPAEVANVANAYRATYGWDPEPAGTQLTAQGAPTAGSPPYAVYRIRMSKLFAFAGDDDHTPTRWRFRP